MRCHSAIFRQQAVAIAQVVLDRRQRSPTPDTYFVGGGVIEAAPHFRDWFLSVGAGRTRRCTRSRPEPR